MAAQTERRIVTDPDVLGGKPRVAGTRIGVYFLAQRVEGRGLRPETVADRHDLALADVYRALAYYHEHPEEMREIERHRERVAEETEPLEPPN
jgi:uncharacterized protein (DUF433 family)